MCCIFDLIFNPQEKNHNLQASLYFCLGFFFFSTILIT